MLARDSAAELGPARFTHCQNNLASGCSWSALGADRYKVSRKPTRSPPPPSCLGCRHRRSTGRDCTPTATGSVGHGCVDVWSSACLIPAAAHRSRAQTVWQVFPAERAVFAVPTVLFVKATRHVISMGRCGARMKHREHRVDFHAAGFYGVSWRLPFDQRLVR